MRTCAPLLPLLLALCACKPADSGAQAIIGAVLIDGSGGPPLSNSVVVVADGRIREAGRHGEIPVSAEIDKIDGSGKYLAPALVDVYSHPDPEVSFATPGPGSAEEARVQLTAMAARKPAAIHVWATGMKADILAALLEAARGVSVPVAGHAVTQADAQSLIENGATTLIGMIRDSEALDPAFVARLRDLRIVYAPALSAIPAGPELERARHNTARMFTSGVLLAAASSGGDLIHECELMAEAGVPALDVVVAATANGARALGQSADRGAILPGRRADLQLLAANPGEDIRNLGRVARRMTAGQWR